MCRLRWSQAPNLRGLLCERAGDPMRHRSDSFHRPPADDLNSLSAKSSDGDRKGHFTATGALNVKKHHPEAHAQARRPGCSAHQRRRSTSNSGAIGAGSTAVAFGRKAQITLPESAPLQLQRDAGRRFQYRACFVATADWTRSLRSRQRQYRGIGLRKRVNPWGYTSMMTRMNPGLEFLGGLFPGPPKCLAPATSDLADARTAARQNAEAPRFIAPAPPIWRKRHDTNFHDTEHAREDRVVPRDLFHAFSA